MTSMIGTSLKSPMSGTRTSATPAGALVGAGGALTAGFAASAAAPAPSSSIVRDRRALAHPVAELHRNVLHDAR
jgi:hypothetical protein